MKKTIKHILFTVSLIFINCSIYSQIEPIEEIYPHYFNKGDTALIQVELSTDEYNMVSATLYSWGDTLNAPVYSYYNGDSICYSFKFYLPETIQAGYYWVILFNDGGWRFQGNNANVFIGHDMSLFQPTICMVTVDLASDKNMIIWDDELPDYVTPLDKVDIYKLDWNYTLIGTVNNTMNYFVDEESNPAQTSSTYRIAFKDSLNNSSQYSIAHKTIHLQMSYGIGGAINLSWNAYEGSFSYEVFNIYRGSSPDDLALLASIPGNTYSYTDLTPLSGDLYYVVSVTNPNGCDVPSVKKTVETIYSSTQSNFVTNIVTSQSDYSNDESVSIMPNPAKQKVFIQSSLNVNELNIQIISLDGRTQMKQKIKNGSEMDISLLKSGIYCLIVEINGIRGIKRLIVE